MNSHDQAQYRLRLAEGFFDEAREDMHSQRWRSSVSNAQLAVENAAKGTIRRSFYPRPFRGAASLRFFVRRWRRSVRGFWAQSFT
jgi:HEPN domain-containing protein